MEKYCKKLSIANVILTALFFLGMSGAVSAQETNTPQLIVTFLTVGVDILLLIVPISYVVVIILFTIMLFKRYMNSRSRMVQSKTEQKKLDKYSIIWFIVSTFSFVGYYTFINLLLNSI